MNFREIKEALAADIARQEEGMTEIEEGLLTSISGGSASKNPTWAEVRWTMAL